MRALITIHPPGVVGVATHFLGRYREFDQALNATLAPVGSSVEWASGVNVARHFNEMVRLTLQSSAEWLWILGDDHVWDPRLLERLLDRQVDVVVPICLTRATPIRPVIHDRACRPLGFDWLQGKSGCLDVTDDLNLGNAGMLIRRKVLEKMPYPQFECGRLSPDLESSDLFFCIKLREAGFRLHLDMDNRIGHVTHAVIWPRMDGGVWTQEVCVP